MSFLMKKGSPLQPTKNGKFNMEKQYNPEAIHLNMKHQTVFALQMMQTLVKTLITIDNKILWQN